MNDQAAGQRAEFAATLARLRQERGWSQTRLGAEIAGKAHHDLGRHGDRPPARQTISRWERGACFPDSLHGYLLCGVFEKSPEELCLHSVVTPQVVARYETRKSHAGQALSMVDVAQRRSTGPPDLDWERLEFVLRAMRHVDLRTVEDQWSLTLRHLDDRRRVRGATTLELLVTHVVRLRQLRTQTRDERLYRELSIMLGQSLIAAGNHWAGRTDFGLAVQAYRGAAAVAVELGEEWLRTTALMNQAQLGSIHAIAPWTPAARLALLEETKGGAVGAAAPIRVWFHATRAQLQALLGQLADAQRSLELAARADALLASDSSFYFAMVDPVYLPIQRASVTLWSGRSPEAVALLRRVVATMDPDTLPIRTWATVCLGHAAAAAGDFEYAVNTLREARRMAQEVDSPLLEHSVARVLAREPWADDGAEGPRHQLDTSR